MAIEVKTKVSVGPTYGKKLGNLILEEAQFFGRPNFAGELDRFKDDRRKFTVLIPNDVADQLREAGWNVKTNIPTAEELEQFPDREPISHLKVMIDTPVFEVDHNGQEVQVRGSEVFLLQGDDVERLSAATLAVVDRSRFENIDMEIRAWEYDPEEQPGSYSARLVKFVGVMTPNLLDAKYGRLR
jgi:hypothetical protein